MTADGALQNAQKRLEELANQINRLAGHLDELKREHASVSRWIDDWHRFAGNATVSSEGGAANSPGGTAVNASPRVGLVTVPWQPHGRPANPDKKDVGRAAWGIIQKRGRPIPRQELFSELTQRGIVIHGKDPEMVLSTMLWRLRDDFVRLPKFGYWLKPYPYKAADYMPGLPIEDDGEDAKVAELAKAEGDE